MNDIPNLRAKPADLCMSDAMPFQQHFEYRTTWPIADILTPNLFMNLHSQLYSGDGITICRYDRMTDSRNRGARMLELAQVRVIASSREGVELHLCGDIEVIPQGDVEPVETGLTAKLKQGKTYSVLDKNGNEVAEGLSKADAEAIASGAMPLPKAKAA